MDAKFKIRGRGASENPSGRFEKIEFVPDLDEEYYSVNPKTVYYKDLTKKIITTNDSPDVIFDASINPYRGCEHGCIYCYARPTHEYLGLSAGLDFETKIFVKENAHLLLEKELSSRSWQPKPIAISGVTDCYQPAEKHFELTRKCLEVLYRFRNPTGIVTKSYLITRDIDLLVKLANFNCVNVIISITTLDSELAGKLEPRAAHPKYRLKAIKKLSEAGVPVMALIAPVIPSLNDYEIPKIIEEAVKAGATRAGYVMLRLPYGVKELFSSWLELNYPDRKNKVLNRIREVRDGDLNSTDYYGRMKGSGIFAEQISDIFRISCKKAGIWDNEIKLDTTHFRRANRNQYDLFDE